MLLAQGCEAVRPHRPDGHGAAWAVLVTNHDQLKAWVVTEGLTAVKAHELLGRRGMVRAAGVAWLASALPHLAYHVGHCGPLTSMDQVASLGGLAWQVELAVTYVFATTSTVGPGSRVLAPAVSEVR